MRNASLLVMLGMCFQEGMINELAPNWDPGLGAAFSVMVSIFFIAVKSLAKLFVMMIYVRLVCM